MVGNYKRKTKVRWSEEDLFAALAEFKQDRSDRSISDIVKRYKVSRATLYRYLQRERFLVAAAEYKQEKSLESSQQQAPEVNFINAVLRRCHMRRGRTLLNPIEENALAQTIQRLRADGWFIGAKEIKQICYRYVIRQGIPNRFDNERELASQEWYLGFCKRQPSLKLQPRKKFRRVGIRTADWRYSDEPADLTGPKNSRWGQRGISKDVDKSVSTCAQNDAVDDYDDAQTENNENFDDEPDNIGIVIWTANETAINIELERSKKRKQRPFFPVQQTRMKNERDAAADHDDALHTKVNLMHNSSVVLT